MESAQHKVSQGGGLYDQIGESRATWIEPAFPIRPIKPDAVLYVYPTPGKRWNGVVYSGQMHVGEVIGGANVEELQRIVSHRQYKIASTKEFPDVRNLRDEMTRRGLRFSFD